MSFVTRWFKKSQPEDYEQALALLANDIQKRQTRLSEIRLRERRTTLLFSIYALSLWVAYVSLWYTNFLPVLSPRNRRLEEYLKGAFVFTGPIVILFIRRIVQIWYNRIGDAEEKNLVALRKKQREKVEEIKKKTNYYSTRNLLERYDEGPTADGLRKRGPPPPVAIPVTPQRPSQPLAPQQQLQQQHLLQTPIPLTPNLQQHLSPSPQRPMPPPRKQWYDKLADAILGDDDAEGVSTAASRYALICQKCFAHNGLVKESVWEDTQYVCPKCGHFNPSARAVRQARSRSRSQRQTPSGARARAPPTAAAADESPTTSGGSDGEGEREREERTMGRGGSGSGKRRGREGSPVGMNGRGREGGVREGEGEGEGSKEGAGVSMDVDS